MLPVPGRDCGSCIHCCKDFAVRAPELKKFAGVRCPHCPAGGGCDIYESRPQPCRDFWCGYRIFPELDDEWRPDRCGVTILFTDEGIPPALAGRGYGLMFDIQKTKALKWDPLVQLIARTIIEGTAAFLTVPGPPGFKGRKYFLNDFMAASVKARDRRRLMADLAHVHDIGMREEKIRDSLDDA